MAKKNNTFDKPFGEFLEKCADVNHAIFFSKHLDDMIQRGLNKRGKRIRDSGRKTEVFTAAKVPVPDVFADSPYPIISPGPGRWTNQEIVRNFATEAICRAHASSLASLHESFESFCRDAYRMLLYQDRRSQDPPKLKLFAIRRPDEAKQRGTATYFQRYVKWACNRDCDEAIQQFRRRLDWNSARREVVVGIKLADAPKCLSVARQLTVHCAGVIDSEKLDKYPQSVREFLNGNTKKPVFGDADTFLPDAPAGMQLVKAIAGYSYAVYRLASEHCNMAVSKPPSDVSGG